LWSSSNNRDGFCFVGCVCGLGGAYVGVVGEGNSRYICQGSLKNRGSTPPQVIDFSDVF
jgi:hypothetical protein